MRNQLTYVKRLLYQLKQDYGLPIDIYKITNNTPNLQTGRKTTTRVKYEIPRAVVLPSVLARKFSYDLSYIAANKNFTYGGFYDVSTRLIIVDRIDLPESVELIVDDYIIFERKRYDIKQFELLENQFGYLLTVKETVGQRANEILTEFLEHLIPLRQQASGVF